LGFIITLNFRLTAEPDAWWLGQFVRYLLRHNNTVRNILNQEEELIDFSSPVVGIHVS
jgi:glycoprotein 6-alpha-L-fucosyltransferase